MTDPGLTHVLEADAVVTGQGEVYAPGAVAVADGRILAVGRPGDGEMPDFPPRRFPDSVILPGLVNAHCHLDLSFLKKPVSFDGSFVWWLAKVGWHRSRASDQSIEAGVRDGLGGLVSTGVTAVGDIATNPLTWSVMRDLGIRGVVYFETIGHRAERVADEKRRIEGLLQDCPPTGLVEVGISPHAAYTVGPRLWELLRGEFAPRVDRFSIHVAEVLEEAAFLEGGWGPFGKFLMVAGLLEKDWKPPGVSPLEYVDRYGLVRPGTSIVHGNFLSGEDIRLLQKGKADGAVCVVHCPRSHRYFQRLPFPLGALEEAGVPVALGTDSLASNESLDMLEEMRVFAAENPGVPPDRVIRMATLNGATALRLDDVTGSIETGKSADLAVIEVSGSRGGGTPEEGVLAASSRCVATISAGRVVYER